MIGNGRISPCVGEMYVKSPGISFGFTAPADVFHKVAGFHGENSKNVTTDKTLGTFTIEHDADYKFDGVASLFPSAGMKINFAVFVNGSKVESIETTVDFKNSQDTQTFSGTGPLWDLKKGDVVDVRGASDTVPVTLNIDFMNINLKLA